MSSFTLPGFPVTHALNRGGAGSETVASHSSKNLQAIDSKDYPSGFYRELRSALDAASGARSTPSTPLSTAIDGLLSGSDLPGDGNDLPVPAMPQTEIGEPTPTGFGFVWLTDPAVAADPAKPDPAITAGATLEARMDALATQPAMADPSASPDPSVGTIQASVSQTDVGQAGASDATASAPGGGSGTQGTGAFAASSLGVASDPATLSAAAGTAGPGMASMSGMAAGIASTGAGAIGTAATQASLSADGPGMEALAASTATAAMLTSETATAVPMPPGAHQPFATQHTAQMGLPMGAPLAAGGPDWGDALAQRIGWMLEGQLGRAEIAIDPPELGPLQVRITTLHDQTQVQFLSQHAAVRDALDQALPRLREMLEAQGLQLAHADVSDEQQSDGRRHSAGALMGQGGSDENIDAAPALDHPSPVMTVGLIDAYA